jgi:hypothetical protein
VGEVFSSRSATTIVIVAEDPLKGALEEIAPKLDDTIGPLATALLGDESVEDAWAKLLQENLDEA